MITFSRFIIESDEAAKTFESAKKIEPFIKSDRYRQAYLESLDAMVLAAKNKEIYNARLNEYKTRIMRGVEYGYKEMFDSIKDDVIKQGEDTSDLWGITSTNEINKVYKIYSKMSTKNSKAITFMEAIVGIPAALKIMKTYVLSGKPKAEPKPGQFVKPASKPEATKMAMSFMKEATDSFRKNLLADVTKQVMSAYEKIKDAKTPKDLPKDDSTKAVATTIFVVKRANGEQILEFIPNHEARLQKLIDNNVNDIVDGFVAKNTQKLSLILQKKGKPKTHSINRTNIRNGMVENSMYFEFEDGSKFDIESSVIYQYSKTGKLFFQYPTRFKNVILADGSRMKMPSEEKIIKEF